MRTLTMTNATNRVDLTPEYRAQLEWAVGMWEKAWHTTDTPAMRQSCHAAAESLRLHLRTGLPHCACHLKPLGPDGCCSVR
jgi:hypothetical protein